MGKVQDMEMAAARKALSLATRSEIDPVTQRLDQIGARLDTVNGQIAQMMEAMGGFLDRLELGEDARAERLRQTINPVLQSTQAAADRTVTVISHLSTGLEVALQEMTVFRAELQSLRSEGTAIALSQQMTWLAQEMAKLPAAVAGHISRVAEEVRTTNPGMIASGGPVLNAAALEKMDKARAFDLLLANQSRSEQGRKVMAQALQAAKAERMRPQPT